MVAVARRLTALALLAFLAFPAWGEDAELAAWFRTDPKARAYAAVRQELASTFEAARTADLPLWILVEKLREGAAKGVPGQRLAEGLQAEAGRLSQAAGILQQQGVAVSDRRMRDEVMRSVSIALLAGLSPEAVKGFFALALPPTRGPQDAVAALAAVIPVRDAGRLAEEDLRRLGAALLESRLPSAAFKSVGSFFLKASASGVRDSDILDTMIIPALKAGGGLVQMEDQLRIFQRRRGSR